jgi:pyruvate,orthophosphate dikinase
MDFVDGAQAWCIGKLPMTEPSLEEQVELMNLLKWADEISAKPDTRKAPKGWPTRGLQVWANADYPKDARRARTYGARGIGLCRTEHMFFEPERLPVVQRMILAGTSEERTTALNELLPHQRKDFDGLFEAMDGLPVIIRLIDPPLHNSCHQETLLRIVTMRIRDRRAREKMLRRSMSCTSQILSGPRPGALSTPCRIVGYK